MLILRYLEAELREKGMVVIDRYNQHESSAATQALPIPLNEASQVKQCQCHRKDTRAAAGAAGDNDARPTKIARPECAATAPAHPVNEAKRKKKIDSWN